MRHQPCDAKLRGRLRASLLAVGVFVSGCSDSAVAPGGNGNGGGNGGAGPMISTLATAPSPVRLVAKNGALYWLDASDTPFNRLGLADGTHTPLLTTIPSPESALSDGSYVYWVSGARLFRTPVHGTTTSLVDQDGVGGVTAGIVMDAGHVYWVTTASSDCSCMFRIRQVPKSGGAPATVVNTSQAVVALVIMNGGLFWEEEGIGPASADGTVTVLVNGLLNGLIPPPGPGWTPASWHPRGGIAVDDSAVYFADADFTVSYRVRSTPVNGGDLRIMFADTTGDPSDFVRAMTQDSSSLYWVDANSLKSMPKGGGAEANLAGTLDSPVGVVRVGRSLFWMETHCCALGNGTIKTVGISGGTPVTVKPGIDAPVSVSADVSHLYWVEGGVIGAMIGIGSLLEAALDGTGEDTLVEAATGGPFDVDATHLYFANRTTIKRKSPFKPQRTNGREPPEAESSVLAKA